MSKKSRRGGVSDKARLQYAGLALLAVVTAGVVGFALMGEPSVPATSPAVASFTPAPIATQKTVPVAAYLGDSYTQGAGTDNATKSFVIVASKQLGWQGKQFADGGTGYVNGGAARNYASRVAAVVAAKPSIVVVSGSRNDATAAPSAVGEAAASVYKSIKAGLPDAKLVVVGPMWTSDTVPESITVLNKTIREAAAANGAVFVDALDPSWLDGTPSLIASDGVHPTEAGHKVLADHFASEVKAALGG